MAENSASTGTPDRDRPAGRSRLLWFGIVVLGVTVAAATVGAYWNITDARHKLETDIAQRQAVLTLARVESVNLWLDSMTEQGARLINADLFRLFASEVNQLEGDVGLLLNKPGQGTDKAPQPAQPGKNGDKTGKPAPRADDDDISQLAAQLPLMRNLLREFVTYSDFVSGRIVNTRAQTYISTDATPVPLSEDQQAAIRAVLETGRMRFSHARSTQTGLVLDLFMPILPPQFEATTGARPVAVLLLSKIISGKVGEFLAASPLVEKGQVSRLVQRTPRGFEEIAPSAQEGLKNVSPPAFAETGDLPFARRISVDGATSVYSTGRKVPQLEWWTVEEIPAELALARLAERERTVVGLAVLCTLLLVVALASLWWWLVGREQREIARDFKALFEVIDDQKQLLDGINSAMTHPVSLTDDQSVFQYVNRAFARAVGRSPEELLGMDMQAVFGFDTARRITAPDAQVLMGGDPATVHEVVYLQSRKRHFQIVKAPLFGPDGRQVRGVVSVFHDITDLVEAQERNRRVVQQTIDALVRAIEQTDPYLAGHSRLMGLAASLTARAMGLGERDVATVEAAANLSQVGKMFVPRDILNKPGKLTAEEKHEMERHVEYARDVLSSIEFDLPVLPAIIQMNERQDGKGYPDGLSGEQISAHARILAVANAFCAMLRPRSYRPALPLDKVLDALESQTDSYDVSVVHGLRDVLDTPAGERLLAQIGAQTGAQAGNGGNGAA